MRRRVTILETVSPAAEPATAAMLAVLHQKTFGRRCAPDYYRWMYGDAGAASVLVVARSDDEIVGAIGARIRTTTGGLRCGQVMDMIVAPEMRGSGVFADMSGCAMEHLGAVDFWFSHANPAGAQALIRKVGFRPVGMVSVLEGQRGALDLAAGDRVYVDTLADELAERICLDGGEAAWRFDNHPSFTYRKLGQSALGAVRVKRFVDGQAELIDLMTPFHGAELPDLVRAADAASQAWTHIHCWSAPHLSAHRTGLAMGFSERAQARHLVGRPASVAGERLTDFSRWFVCAADAEYM